MRTLIRRVSVGLLCVVSLVAGSMLWERQGEAGADTGDLPTAVVRRVESSPSVTISGEVRSLDRTTITMDVEDMQGNELMSGGYLAAERGPAPTTTILWVIPDGSNVKKGDVICRLESSWFEEQRRLQAIEVELVTAETTRAELNLGVAQAELKTFREGERVRQQSQNETAVALALAKQSRARDHLEWTTRMLGMGYLSISDVKSEEVEVIRAEVELNRARMLENVFEQYRVPRTLRYWEAEVEKADAEFEFARTQLQIERDRLTLLEKQLAACTISAPHDGRIIYADLHVRQWYQIRVGGEVYSGQELFYLPKLDHMSVEVEIPESVVSRLKPGQDVQIAIAAFPGRQFRGRVKKVETLPQINWKILDFPPLFYGEIEILDSGGALLPQMTAKATITTGPTTSRLVIPVETVLVRGGESYCDVVRRGDIERRKVDLSPAGTDLVEVLSGLDEGDAVLLYPWKSERAYSLN